MKITSSSNRRIAKNTMFMYFRMLIIMLVSLYTSRVVLKVLGVEDYGIYNLVAGVIVIFSFINSAMTSATQRFLNFALGLGDKNEVKRVFSMSMTAHISIAVLVFILGETVGLWFFNTQLNISQERMYAAQWVYQFAILTTCISIIRVPYHASIIAYEKMSFFAYVSIIETFLKLFIVYLLTVFVFDKLIVYAILIFGVSTIMLGVYKIYCNKVFDTCRYSFFWDTSLYKKLMSFSGWSLFGAASNVGANQGLNILLNIFYGVVVNAAVGVANQVGGAVYQFVSNFQISFAPQITKLYASNQLEKLQRLIFSASKISYFLMFFLALPLILCSNFILNIWLDVVPEYATEFCQLWIGFLLVDAFSAPLWMLVQAKGRIRNYQILMGIIIFFNLPFSYLVLKLGAEPYTVYMIRILVNFITVFARIIYLTKNMDFPAMLFIKKVFLKCIFVTILSIPIPLIVHYHFTDWTGLILTTFTAVVSSGMLIYFYGFDIYERDFIKSIASKILQRIK